MQVEWELSQSLSSDGQGIRAACVLPAKTEVDSFRVVTGTQGGSLIEYGVPSGNLSVVDYQHNHAVTALVATEAKDGYVTGCKDAMIRVFDADHNLKQTLSGHEKPVTSLDWAHTGDGTPFLVSGSWDGQAKVWNLTTGAMVATLEGHENSVCVTGLPSEDASSLVIATGSAGIAQNNQISGYTVRLWTVNVVTGQRSMTANVANDHEGPIRDVSFLPHNNLLATCSNDGTVMLRLVDSADSVSTLSFLPSMQHPPMLLSVEPIQEGLCASAEDGHVVVWNQLEGVEPQILLHATCVWNVVSLPNGDIATCCDDGTLRIFTKDTERRASSEEIEAFHKAVQEAHQKHKSGPTAEEIAKLPLWENNLQHRGTSEGQVQVFNKGGIAIAAQWSATSQTWIEVGQVTGKSDGGTIDGVKYDHVLPIEVDQTGGGVAKLQIGYNDGENPFVAAQRFIDQYMLPQHHLNEIADYIQQRVGNQPTTLGGAAATGGTSGPASAGSAAAVTGVPMVAYEHLPITAFKWFDLPAKTASTVMGKMKTKLQEFDKLNTSQMESISALMETLLATNKYHVSTVPPEQLAVLSEMLSTLPLEEAFPALDLARLSVCHPDAAASKNAAFWSKLIDQALGLCTSASSLQGTAAVAIPMLSLRLFCNAFRGGPGSKEAVVGKLGEVVVCAASFVNSSNKNVRLSVASLLYNVAFHYHSSNVTMPQVATQTLEALDNILKARSYETEALIRTLLALGTIVLASPEAKAYGKSLYTVSRVEMSASPHGDLAKAIAKEVYAVFQ